MYGLLNQKMKARNALVKDIKSETASKNIPPVFIKKNKKSMEELYEVQSIKSSAQVFREMRSSGQIKTAFELPPKVNVNAAADAQSAGSAVPSWLPAALIGVFALGGMSWGLSQQSSSDYTSLSSSAHLPAHMDVPALSQAQDVAPIPAVQSVEDRSMAQQPLWLQRPRR